MDSKLILKQLTKAKNKNNRVRKISGYLKLIKFLFFLAIAVIVIIIIFYTFKIKTVRINNGEQIKIDYLYNKNLLLLDPDVEAERISFKNPNIASVILTKQYPSTIIISNIKKEIPIYQLKVDNGYYILSTNGKIIAKNRKVKLGMVKVNFYQQYNYAQYSVGTKLINSELLSAIKIITDYKKYNLAVKSVDIANNDMILLHSDILIVFSAKKPIDIQILQSKAILQKIKQQGLEIGKLDFRFDKPILEFSN